MRLRPRRAGYRDLSPCAIRSELERSVALNETAAPRGAELRAQSFGALATGCAQPHSIPGRSRSDRSSKHDWLVSPQKWCVFIQHLLVCGARTGLRPAPDQLHRPGKLVLLGRKQALRRWVRQAFRDSWTGHRFASTGPQHIRSLRRRCICASTCSASSRRRVPGAPRGWSGCCRSLSRSRDGIPSAPCSPGSLRPNARRTCQGCGSTTIVVGKRPPANA
jgi:hypothetical protein